VPRAVTPEAPTSPESFPIQVDLGHLAFFFLPQRTFPPLLLWITTFAYLKNHHDICDILWNFRNMCDLLAFNSSIAQTYIILEYRKEQLF
jgi:hypothetical protein